MDLNAAVAEVIGEELIARGQSLRAMEPRLQGHSYNWLWERLNGKTRIAIDDVELMASALDLDPKRLLMRALDKSRTTD